MSGPELTQSLETFEFIVFRLVQAVLFFGGLWGVINWHFHITHKLRKRPKRARQSPKPRAPRKPNVLSRGT